MRIVASRLHERVVSVRIADWVRILSSRHRVTPADTGFGPSRFSSPSRAFRGLYAADSFPTAFAEAVVRDRFASKARRFLYRPDLENLGMTAIGSNRELMLLDPKVRQDLSERMHAEMCDIDGILFNSRLTAGRTCAPGNNGPRRKRDFGNSA